VVDQGTIKRHKGAPKRQRIDVRGAKGHRSKQRQWWEKISRVVYDDGRTMELESLPETILHFSCTQAPFQHPDALAFLDAVKRAYAPDLVLCHGDEADLQCLKKAFMGADSPGPGLELELTKEFIAGLADVFPRMLLLSSNHVDGRIRYAQAQGNIPTIMLRPWRDIIEAPAEWEWRKYIIARNWAWEHGHDVSKGSRSTVEEDTCKRFGRPLSIMKGHIHSELGDHIKPVWTDGMKQQLRIVFTGCLMDERQVSYTNGPTVNGCVVSVRGMPVPVPMLKNRAKRWTGDLPTW
jgi:hypothetical protein